MENLKSPNQIADLPIIQVLPTVNLPYLKKISNIEHKIWHLDIELNKWNIPDELEERWKDKTLKSKESWNKRPLLIGDTINGEFSCGEVEIAALLRQAGYEAYWVSEWSSYNHVQCWKEFCIKRKELEDRLPFIWELDKNLREHALQIGINLRKSGGGHPDIVAWHPETKNVVYFEYKGPKDRIGKDSPQARWIRAFYRQSKSQTNFFIINGIIK